MRASLFALVTCFAFALAASEEALPPQNESAPEIVLNEPAPTPEISAQPSLEPTQSQDNPDPSLVLAETPAIIAAKPFVSSPEGYTINYNTISILEYVRFASKICNVNFIFNNGDLDFTVTVVSDAPITPENVMSTLIQVLRMHGLELLEQDNNLVIHKAGDVRQLATLVTETGQGGKAAIVTRIFRIKNAKVDSIAAIIRPMISTAAIMETAVDTRQLILTDIRTNVDKVASLIEILDSPSMPLEIKSYEGAHANALDHLIEITQQMMAPMAQGNPFVMVANDLANTIYIVSTPELVGRAVGILKIIDVPPNAFLMRERRLKSENIFIYNPLHRGGQDLLGALHDVAGNLKKAGLTEGDLIPTIEMARWIGESNAILFVGTKESLDKVKELLASFDRPLAGPGEGMSFFIYTPQNRSAKDLLNAIHEMSQNLKDSKITDREMLNTLSSARLNESANSLTFSGEEKTFSGVKELLVMIDGKGPVRQAKSSFFLYKAQNTTPQVVETSLKNFASTLDKSKSPDVQLIDTIHNMQIVGETGSILFTGSESTLKRLQDLLPTFDIVQAGLQNQFYIYKPKSMRGEQLVSSLKELASDLQASHFSDTALLRTLQSVKYVKSTNSCLFTGDAASIKKLDDLIASIDNPQAKAKNFILYSPKYVSKEKLDEYLKQLSDNLGKKGGSEDLMASIRSMKWIEASHSFLFHGSDTTLDQLSVLLDQFDTAANAGGSSNFFMYKPQYISAEQALSVLHDVLANLKKSSLSDPNLIQGIESAKVVETTHSIVFTGTPDTIQKIQSLLKEIDVPSAGKMAAGYFLYKLQTASGDDVLKELNAIVGTSGLKDSKAVDVVHNIRYIKETNSLLLTGDPKAIDETKELIAHYDVPSAQQQGYFIYKIQNTTGDLLKQDLDNFSKDFAT